MKKHYWLQIRILLLTLALGIACVSFWNSQIDQSVDEELAAATIIGIANIPRFTETYRACGYGYVQGYVTNDGSKLTESGCDERKLHLGKLYAKDKDGSTYVFDLETEGGRSYALYSRRSSHCIDAPSYELAVELRNYLEGAPGESWKR